jgi:Protein of unknown function (DUF4058)
MPFPFPGMDPYLEHPSAWPNIHHRMITAIADVLAPQLLPKYQILVEERIYQVEGNDSILSYLEMREIATGQVVTVIEVLSPVNKRSGKGRIDYENKRAMVFASSSNFVEIDLLRQWKPLPVEGSPPRSSYRILVSIQENRPQADLYAFNLPDPIPCFPLPLRSEDVCPVVDLRALLDGIYDRSGYGLVIDYQQPPIPELSERDRIWMQDWLTKLK